ncbi:MAG: hypothetical protein IIZ06_06845 [Kiritimatiellae bacterium]|nr:hypothetical protein [Kiritimatiellia bacterium]
MSFKLLKIGRDALRRVRIGRVALVAAAVCVATAPSPSWAATYYKVGSDEKNTSSFAGNVDNTHGWNTTQGASSTATVSDFANSDFIVGSGLTLRTPVESNDDIAFGGRSFTLTGGGALGLKKRSNGGTRRLTISSMVVDGAGTIGMSQGESLFILDGAITLNANSTFAVAFACADAPDWRALTIDAALTGDASTTLHVRDYDNGGSGSRPLVLNNVGAFLGTITGADTAKSLDLTVNGAFGGTITSLPATTKSVTFDYAGLPAATGLRVASTTIPAALKTKLLFYSATTDFSAAGLPLLTFPAGTSVDPAEFTIKYADSPDGEARQFELMLVTNGDDTLTLVSKGGKTFYKVDNDAKDTSSFAGNVSSTVGWAATSGASATTSFSALEMTNSTFIVGSGTLLRTPADSTSDTFGGKVLRLEGNGTDTSMSLKGANNSTVTIPHLVSQNGRIFAGDTDRSYTLKGKIDIVSGYGLYLCGHDSGTRTMYVDAAICGDATTKLVFPQNNTGTGTQVLHINNAADFFGEATVTATSYGPTKLYINGAFGGSVGALGAKLSTLVVNYDGLPADKGLRCTAASVPAPLKTKLTLYSATADFGQDRLPLITFPAGTAVDPTQFTVKYATSRDGAATAFPRLTTYTAGDGSVVLAVDASYPATARWVSGAWRFYGTDGSDVTATCGLSAPTAATTVLIGSTDELTAVRAAGVTPKGYRLTADFDVTGATDLTDFAGFEIEPGYAIDLKGKSLTLDGTFFASAVSAGESLLVNGDFEADDLGGATPVPALPTGHVPSGWTKAGMTGLNELGYQKVFLIRNDSTYGYQQRSDNSTWTRIEKSYWISQEFTLPHDAVVSLSFKVAATASSNGSANKTDCIVQFDGTEAMTIAGHGWTTEAKSGLYFPLSAGTHTITFLCPSTAGVAMLLDDVKLTVVGGAVTDSVGGGELHVNVATNTVVHNTSVALTGGLRFVKEGWGRFYSQCLGQSYSGGNEVVRGLFGPEPGSGTSRRHNALHRPLGALGSQILVREEGTFDIGGNYDYGAYDVVLDGGTLRSAAADDAYVHQTETETDGLGAFSLTTNSTLFLRSDTIVNGWNESPVNLGGHELFVNASSGYKQLFWSKDIVNGTLRFGACASEKSSRLVIYGRDVDARTVDFIDEGGLVLNAALSVRDYTAARAYSNVNSAGTTNLCVYGTFTPQTDYFYGCTMMDGSAIDLSGKTAPWSLTSAETAGGLTNVVFETGATVTVKLGGRSLSSRSPVIAWNDDNRPANLDTLKFTSVEGERRRNFIKKEDGLYVTSGFMVIVK